MKPQSILVVGGSGTLGVEVIPLLLADPSVDRVRVLSRGEHRQAIAAEKINSDRVDWILGDVKDYESVAYAMEGCESVFNFAAIKSVHLAEYNCEETIKVIIDGARNCVRAAKSKGVSRCMLTSTDKAVSPHNLYGTAKACAEKLWISEGNKGAAQTRFSVCRYGNVLASQGSVIAAWEKILREGKSPKITNLDHTRFFILPRDAGVFVVGMWASMTGGEIFIPKMKATPIGKLYGAFLAAHDDLEKDIPAEIIGDRPGEKIHEALVSPEEAAFVTDCGSYMIRWPEQPMYPVKIVGNIGVYPYTSQDAERFSGQEMVNMIKEVLCT